MGGKGCWELWLHMSSTLVICSCNNFPTDSWAGSVCLGRMGGDSGRSCVRWGTVTGTCAWSRCDISWYKSGGLEDPRSDFQLGLSHWPWGTPDLLIHLWNLRIIYFFFSKKYIEVILYPCQVTLPQMELCLCCRLSAFYNSVSNSMQTVKF